jgi:hypothetical protein
LVWETHLQDSKIWLDVYVYNLFTVTLSIRIQFFFSFQITQWLEIQLLRWISGRSGIEPRCLHIKCDIPTNWAIKLIYPSIYSYESELRKAGKSDFWILFLLKIIWQIDLDKITKLITQKSIAQESIVPFLNIRSKNINNRNARACLLIREENSKKLYELKRTVTRVVVANCS